MKRYILYIALLIILNISCKVQVDQYQNGKKHGKWISKTTEEGSYSIGRYKHGIETGTWKQFEDGKLYRKERYRGKNSVITFYHTNGKVDSKGKSKNDNTQKVLRWYYCGKWKYYNQSGKLTAIRIYEKGLAISEKQIN